MGMKMAGRLLALACAAALLPCCTQDAGQQGDALSRVTVRVSVLPFGQEANAVPTGAGNDGSTNPSISADGRYVAFESNSTNLTPGDSNGLRDIFVKDRLTGAIENITNLVSGEFGPFPADNFNPAISGDGRFVAFESKGSYFIGLFGTLPKKMVWVYDRVNKTFKSAVENLFVPPNDDCTNASLSYDGRFVTWRSAATNIDSRTTGGITYTNPVPTFNYLIYVTDVTYPSAGPIVRLVSHRNADTTTGCTGACNSPHISGDGTFVVFESQGTNLVPTFTAGDLDIYGCTLTTAPLPLEIVSIGFNPTSLATEKARTGASGAGLSMSSSVSFDGRFVAFGTNATNWGFPTFAFVARRDRTAGLTEMVGPDLGTISGIILAFDRTGLSADGQSVVYMNTAVQAEVRNIATGGAEVVSVNISGQVANRQPFAPTLSADGMWAAWHTYSEILVANDTNGVNDVFVRGPLR
jgi:hypothetical protein